MIRQFRDDRFWDRTLGHGFPCLAILRGEGVSVKVNITDADGFYVTPTQPRRHGQKYPRHTESQDRKSHARASDPRTDHHRTV